MVQDVFMTSMYFLVPLRRISYCYNKHKQLNFSKKGYPAFIRNGEGNCEFAVVPIDHKFFTYTYINIDGTKETTRRVEMKAFILRYKPCREKAIIFSRKQNRPYLLYYGTERGMNHKKDCFSGEPYADEQVRECMDWKTKFIYL